MTRPALLAEDVSNALLKALPRDSRMVDHYREYAIWDQAILASLALVADSDKPELPTLSG
jgi:hypothetical protein